jgi:predicted nucleic acid-binding protein
VICVDASVAVKWILEEERSDLAMALYNAVVHAGQSIAAPPLLPLEVTNILRQRMRTNPEVSLTDATEQLDDFLALPIDYHNPTGLHHQALVLADALGLPATTTPTTWCWPSILVASSGRTTSDCYGTSRPACPSCAGSAITR